MLLYRNAKSHVYNGPHSIHRTSADLFERFFEPFKFRGTSLHMVIVNQRQPLVEQDILVAQWNRPCHCKLLVSSPFCHSHCGVIRPYSLRKEYGQGEAPLCCPVLVLHGRRHHRVIMFGSLADPRTRSLRVSHAQHNTFWGGSSFVLAVTTLEPPPGPSAKHSENLYVSSPSSTA